MASPHAIRRSVENAYLERERDRRRLRELLGVLVAVVVLGGGLLGYTWMHTEILRTGYRIDQLEQTVRTLQATERRLRLAVALGTQPEQIETRAQRELGMRRPALDQILFYDELQLGSVAP